MNKHGCLCYKCYFKLLTKSTSVVLTRAVQELTSSLVGLREKKILIYLSLNIIPYSLTSAGPIDYALKLHLFHCISPSVRANAFSYEHTSDISKSSLKHIAYLFCPSTFSSVFS